MPTVSGGSAKAAILEPNRPGTARALEMKASAMPHQKSHHRHELAVAPAREVACVTDATAVAAERAAHTLKSTSARFGLHALARLAGEAEAAVRSGQADKVQALVDAMHDEFAHARPLLIEHLEGLGSTSAPRAA